MESQIQPPPAGPEEDLHLCLLCRNTIHGIDNYVRHRAEAACNKQQQSNDAAEKARQHVSPGGGGGLETSADDFFHYIQLQHKTTTVTAQQQQQGSPFKSPAIASSSTASTSSRNRRPSSDEAAHFMASLQLQQTTSPRRSLLSPGRNGPWGDDAAAAGLLLQGWSAARGVHEAIAEEEVAAEEEADGRMVEGPSSSAQNDFMRQIDLVNVSSVEDAAAGRPHGSVSAPAATSSSTPQSGRHCRLWNPETDHESDDLWSFNQVFQGSDLILESSCNDPTLMEVEAATAAEAQAADSERNAEDNGVSESSQPVGKVISPANPPRFYCNDCERSLATKELYDKHVLSELHFKRASSLSVGQDPSQARKRKRNPKYEEAEDSSSKSVQPASSDPDMITCESCHTRTAASLFSKHLISHYHHHRSRLPANHPAAQRLVLRHIEEIVKLAPFQCRQCRFFCNWENEFLAHWNSDMHRRRAAETAKSDETAFWCSFCDYLGPDNEAMTVHLRGERHGEIVVAVGRHVPIVIRRVKQHRCSVCSKVFRLKFSLRRHMRRAHGDYADIFEEQFACQDCNFSSGNEADLAEHSFLAHPERRSKYSCLACRMQFHSKKAAESHRKSRQHRAASGATQDKPLTMNCDHCKSSFDDASDLKAHVRSEHAAELSKCGMCGEAFALPQDLGAHVRRGICSPNASSATSGDLICGEAGCPFSCDTMNTFIFHQSLAHNSSEGNDSRASFNFQCVVCSLTVPSRSRLWEHVRTHGDSSRCEHCYRSFVSEEKLRLHITSKHSEDLPDRKCDRCDYETDKPKLLQLHKSRVHFEPRKCVPCGGKVLSTYRSFHDHQKKHKARKQEPRLSCDKTGCTYSSDDRAHFKKHLLCHAEKRFECDRCDFRCKRSHELSRHMKTRHHELKKGEEEMKKFRCEKCDYKTFSRQHFERHSRTHGGEAAAAPTTQYRCRLCCFRAPNVDNVRKHILKTNKHPGASVYACEACADCETNSAAEYRRHIEAHHADRFRTAFDLDKHVKEYFAVMP